RHPLPAALLLPRKIRSCSLARNRQGARGATAGDRASAATQDESVERSGLPPLRSGVIMHAKRKPTRDAVEILHRRFFEGRPDMLAGLEEARASAAIAREVYTLREKAGLTQRELAKLVKTTPSVISRLESDDYDGHSLNMLFRIAYALGKRVEVRFVPLKQ